MLLTPVFILTFSFSVLFASEPIDKNALRSFPPEIVSIKTEPASFIEDLVAEVSYDSLHQILSYLDEKGIRSAGGNNTTLNEIGQWLKDKLNDWDFRVTTQDVTSYGQNIIAEKTGTVYPEIKVIISAHYDSVQSGPGINDNGSGVAALLEVARILKDVETEYSILFTLFTAEEKGLVGSRAYANKVSAENMPILIVFKLDQIGGINDINSAYEMTTITCERDEGNSQSGNDTPSYAYTDTLAMMTNTYTEIKTTIAHAYGSDYMPFESKGYVITGYYEYVPGGNPYYHKATDLLKNMNVPYLHEVTKGAVAFSAHVSRYKESTPTAYKPPVHKQANISIKQLAADPINNSFRIYYHLENNGLVELVYFDGSGRIIGILHSGYQQAGTHTMHRQLSTASSLYFIKLLFNGKSEQTIKLVQIK